jgi:cytidine deaminase
LNIARQALNRAYAPYSGFQVGAALRLENGEIISGNNQENIAFPSGLCAERTALFYASSKFPGVAIKSIAVCARSKRAIVKTPITPCGSCRQVMAEYEINQKQAMRIILASEADKIWVMEGVGNILPFMFKADELKSV